MVYRVYIDGDSDYEITNYYKEVDDDIDSTQYNCLKSQGFYLPNVDHHLEHPYYHIDNSFDGVSNYTFIEKMRLQLKSSLRERIINNLLYEDL